MGLNPLGAHYWGNCTCRPYSLTNPSSSSSPSDTHVSSKTYQIYPVVLKPLYKSHWFQYTYFNKYIREGSGDNTLGNLDICSGKYIRGPLSPGLYW